MGLRGGGGSLLRLHSKAASVLVAVFPAEFLEVVHVPHNIFHPWFSGGHTEAPMVPGQQKHGVNGAALSSELH